MTDYTEFSNEETQVTEEPSKKEKILMAAGKYGIYVLGASIAIGAGICGVKLYKWNKNHDAKVAKLKDAFNHVTLTDTDVIDEQVFTDYAPQIEDAIIDGKSIVIESAFKNMQNIPDRLVKITVETDVQ